MHHKKPIPPPADTPAETAADAPAADVPEAVPADPSVTECEALRQQLEELTHLNLRQRADFDNARKRLVRQAAENGDRVLATFVRPVLIELDNLTRALAHATTGSLTEFTQGVGMIHGNLLTILGNAGIEEVPATGIFDPALHEVLAEIPGDAPRGTILQVERAGYRLPGQLIRAAQVLVSAGPAVPAEPAVASPPATGEEPDAAQTTPGK
jgi:molecular chaperone GrpE